MKSRKSIFFSCFVTIFYGNLLKLRSKTPVGSCYMHEAPPKGGGVGGFRVACLNLKNLVSVLCQCFTLL